MRQKKSLIALIILLELAGCSKANLDATNYPKPREEVELEKMGKLTGEQGIVLFGGNSKKGKGEKSGISVNSYLWRATLDTVHFMPITKIDPFAGVIMTDWYSPPHHPKERFKLNLFVLSGHLRSDSIRVSAFRQVLRGHDWVDATPSLQFINSIEEKILVRARELKVRDQR